MQVVIDQTLFIYGIHIVSGIVESG